ncbi:hypothetical protein EN871_24100 [bacterium M00.F.Ca.ET.228.01.1.1]|uniref:hypothetical protein n=1 Tax=Paraburkholderia phenoliruptrix TaxID=252970 RepID=UPI001091EDFD|nr:hypothetical protein [Paraburkholderia phenoliruptrix]TGP41537.1 hypothetical protein EN871_24100 [bacterium M00.F.Ca.ET.228.01.1.1]TGR98195.1 hypothetical protein EN834_23715 [bacterium M00.F.Ca.ET.191.01.1.1]TGU02386.1 hypothetical protein EN798_24535 [bacterium M00.F.Ca.ET.155.01.1.1]MBW0447189.1 hypothetical protein [Paraburkholderia phenoliruptrix]MBW9101428.1 hypothetical protein [Paraburkholderia phenoliruptrix]
MSIFSKIKHAFQHLGHDIEKAAKAVVHGVEHVAHAIENDIRKVLQDALAMTEALMQGNLKLAMQDLLKTGEDVAKTASDAATAATEATLEGLQDLHLGKGFDKALGKIEKGVESVKKDVNKGIDAAAEDLVSSVEGVVSGSVDAIKDLAHGNFGAMMNDVAKVGEDALEAAADLTPEGLTATVAASTLAAAHIGSAALDNTIAGAMHGGIGKVVKSVAERGVSEGAQKYADKVLGSGGADTLTSAGGTVVMLSSMASARGARRSGHQGAEGLHESRSYQTEKPEGAAPQEHKTAGGQSEAKNDGKAEDGTGKKDDKSKDKNDNDDKNRAGQAPTVLDTLLLSYLADNRRRTA